MPLPESHCVGQRCAATDNTAGSLDVGPVIEECIDYINVIAAGGPVERGLGVASRKQGIDFGPISDQCDHGRYIVRKVSRPVSGYVEQRTLTVYPSLREAAVFA